MKTKVSIYEFPNFYYSFYVDFPYQKSEIKTILSKMYDMIPHSKPWYFEVFDSINKSKSVVLYFTDKKEIVKINPQGDIPPLRTLVVYEDETDSIKLLNKKTRTKINEEHTQLVTKRTDTTLILNMFPLPLSQ